METPILLQQKPIIYHELKAVGELVDKRIQDLNIDSQIATEESVKSLKSLRAELNKELEIYENQRKAIKEGVMNPYNEFEGIYKTEVSEKYKSAIDKLKTKIDLVETKIKDEKRAEIVAYFNELCLSENIDFVEFGQVGLKIDLSTSIKNYRETCNAFISKVVDDLKLIDTHEYKAEVLVEYKKSLNVSKAITEIVARKEAEDAEIAKMKAIQLKNRQSQIIAMGLVADNFTKVFAYSNDIYIKYDDARDLSNEEFAEKIEHIKLLIEEYAKQQEVAKITQSPQQQENLFKEVDAKDVDYVQVAPSQPLQAPKIEPTQEVVTASFEVTGTMSQLKALGQYMRDNNITYKNIE